MSETTELRSPEFQIRTVEKCEVDAVIRQPQISYSTIATEEVKELVIRYYNVPEPLHCVFYNRGFNDIYRLSSSERQFALRISPVNGRGHSALMAELAVVNHVNSKGVEVVIPVSRADGSWITEIAAPEGLRRAIAFGWAAGSAPKYNSELHARQLGRLMAKVHTALDDIAPQSELPNLRVDYLPRKSLDVIYLGMATNADLLVKFTELIQRLESRLDAAHKSLYDWGLCHGDVGNYNALFDGDRCVLFDFEFCGWGWRLFDLASYRLHARCEGFEMQAWKPFIQEYLALRPDAETSLTHVGLFMCLRHLWVAARRIEHLVEFGVGSIPGNYYEMLVHFCKEIESELPRQ
jgi:Ser/Thr protein kinase RdoA (MazF antagonist)